MKTKLLLSFLFLFSLTGYAQFFEGFENTTGPDALPLTNWTLASGNWAVFDNGIGPAQRWKQNATISNPPQVYQGNFSASVATENIGLGNTSQEFLATPLVTIPTNGVLRFFSRTYTSGDQGTKFKIMIAPGNNASNQTNPTVYVPIVQWTETTLNTTFDSYEEKVVSLTGFEGTTVYIAFVKEYTQPTSAMGGDRWLVDNISISDSPPCTAPTAFSVTSVTSTSANISWVENAMATSWHILLLPQGAPAPTLTTTGWFVTPTNPFTLVGLNPNTTYDIYIRSVCGNGSVSDWSNPTTFTTPNAPPVCGGTFLDQGGPNANYSNNSDSVTTICPSNPGETVSVTFSSFNTEASHDALYVYDGFNVGVSLISSSNSGGNVPGGLPGGYWGNTIPGPFTSTTLDGCLTFRFVSDGANTLEGWVANVDCVPQVCNAPTNLAVSNLTETSAVVSWVNTTNSYNAEVLVLPDGAPAPTPADAGSIVSSNSYVLTGLSPNQCYTVYIRSSCNFNSDWSSPVSFCMVNCENNASCAESLVLTAFIDSNSNGVKDSGENYFPSGYFIYEKNNSGINQYGYAATGPYYIFDSNSANSYDIHFQINSGSSANYSCSVAYNNMTLPTGGGANVLYFPIVITQPFIDAQTYIYSTNQPRPGFSYYNTIFYQNMGTQTIANGTLTFTKDAALAINSISEVGTLPTVNGFTFNFTNLAPFETRFIEVGLSVPPIPTVSLGQLLTSTATIDISNDSDLTNNSSSIIKPIVGSYDPNEKSEAHGGKIGLDSFTSNDYLYYTIQFENTGTANAEFIKVEDVLDAGLDENTFEMISASHTVNTKREGNQLTWHFYNINLPPTVANPTGSHGNVYFKIKPKPGYVVGDVIPNTASIYFDYNPPIVTNTCATEFVTTLSNALFTEDSIALYPNPAHHMVYINIQNTTDMMESIRVYDVLGKTIALISHLSTNQTTLDTSSFAKGVYMMEISSEDHLKQIKKLVIQ